MRTVVLLVVAGCGFRHGELHVDDGAVGDGDVAADTRSDAFACPPDFAAVSGAPVGSRYRTFGAQSYAGAVATCTNLGTHLLRLDTQGEADALFQLIDGATTGAGDTHIYRVVGRRDRMVTPHTWLDLDGVTPLTFLPWGIGEPTNGATEDCMSLRTEIDPSQKVIGADECTTLHEFACECE